MRRNQLTYDVLQNEHLDNLLRLAYKYESALETQALLDESQRDFTDEERLQFENAYSLFLDKKNALAAKESRTVFLNRFKRQLPKIIQIAACIVLLLGVSAPFAIAHVAPIRSAVMELLIAIQDDYTELSFVEDESAAFDVPAEWTGDYYLSYIPEGYHLTEISSYYPTVKYSTPDGITFKFCEHSASDFVSIDSEDSSISYETVNGYLAYIAEKEECYLSWANGDKYFVIVHNGSKESALEIAESVKKIHQ